jgi:hypothetical protein
METLAPQPLPPEIRVERRAPGDLRYVLPRRPLGNYRWLGVAPLVFGLIALSFAWEWYATLVQMQMQAFSLIFGILGALCIGSSIVVPIAIGVAMIWGHSSIEIRGSQLWSIEHVGPFRWGRKWPLAQIRQLQVERSSNESSAQAPSANSPLARFAAIRIETAAGKPRLGTIGYPREWLLPLAHELAAQVRAVQADLSDPRALDKPQVNVVDVVEVVHDRAPAQRFDQPAGSSIVMTEQPGSLTFDVPPAGIKRGTAGLFVFACFWLAFMAVVSCALVGEFVRPAPQRPQTNLWASISLLSLFWLVGIGLMLGALHMARRRASVAVAEGRCLIVQVGLFGEKKRVWESGELSVVQVGPSGMEDNDQPVMELQFIPRKGQKFGILSARDVPELEWLATRLTKVLDLLPAHPGAVFVASVDAKPSDSNVVCEQMPGVLTFSIPRSRLFGLPLFFWIIAIIWNGGVAVAIGLTNANNGLDNSPSALAIISVFGVIGLGLIGGAIHMTIRRAEIAFAAGRLLVLQFGLFGKRRREWAVEELAAIRSAVSNTKLNDRPLMWLQIVPAGGKTVSLLTGRDDKELAWIATLLRGALKLPAQTDQERGV